MSDLVFPALDGLECNVVRAPIWSTTKRASVSGRQFRFANFSYPRYRYKLSYSVLRQGAGYAELAQLAGLFNQVHGDFDTFLWSDPADAAVSAQAIGTGNGSATQFQLVRTFGGFVEPVHDVNGAPQIYVNGVLQTLTTHYTLGSTGLVTFVSAPANGLPIAWTGAYYRRVVFSQSMLEFNKFLANLWELKRVEFESWRP